MLHIVFDDIRRMRMILCALIVCDQACLSVVSLMGSLIYPRERSQTRFRASRCFDDISTGGMISRR